MNGPFYLTLLILLENIYLDFSHAFDSVPRERLITKLYSLGFQGKLLDWINCFLTGRSQCVRLDDNYSSLAEIISGVPQGSVLGSVLFITFINDLADTVSGLVKIFADDSKIDSSVENEQQQQVLQNDLDRKCDWSRKWKLSFNATKCKVMHFGTNNNRSRYTMLDHSDDYAQVSPVIEEKDLGVTFEPNLKFDKHISNC